MSADIINIREGWRPQWTFAEKLRKVRRESGLSQQEFSQQLSVGESQYKAWEAGRNMPREFEDLVRTVARVTGVSEAWLAEGTGHNPTGPGTVGEEGLEPPTFRVETRARHLWAIAS